MKETVWDKYWKENKFGNKQVIENVKNSFFWKELKQIILKKFGSFKNLKIVELGSGRGEVSLLMALEGADIILIDESEFALREAKKLYKEFNCKVITLQKDIFDLKNKDYDIALSFGVAEHFEDEKRLEIFKKHCDMIKDKGMIILGIPNARCYPYRIYKFFATSFGFWKYGLEIPFSENELKNIGNKLNITNYEIIGSSFVSSFYHFLIMNPLKLLGINLKDRFNEISLLNKYGFGLTFIGEK